MDRLTYFCEECGKYYFTNFQEKTVKLKKYVEYEFTGNVVEKLATFENLMEKYEIKDFSELEELLKKKN